MSTVRRGSRQAPTSILTFPTTLADFFSWIHAFVGKTMRLRTPLPVKTSVDATVVLSNRAAPFPGGNDNTPYFCCRAERATR